MFAVAPGVDPSPALSEHGPYLVGATTALNDASINATTDTHRASSGRHRGPAGPTLSRDKLLHLRTESISSRWICRPRDHPRPTHARSAERFTARLPSHRPFFRSTCDTPSLRRYGFSPRSCGSHGRALAFPDRALESGPSRFISARLGTPTVAPTSDCVHSA